MRDAYRGGRGTDESLLNLASLHSHEISRSLYRIGSAQAADLFVDLVAGKTAVFGFAVIAGFNVELQSAKGDFVKHLGRHERFKDAVWSHATGAFRSHVATVSARMGWTDMVPRIRTMTEDPDLDVREAAAAALTVLAGEKREIARPAVSFPAMDVREGLLLPPITFPRRGFQNADFVKVMTWFDQEAGVVSGLTSDFARLDHPGELHLLTDTLEEKSVWPMPYELHALERLPMAEGGFQVVGLVDIEGKGSQTWQGVVAWKQDGTERWRRKTPEQFLRGIAPLYGEQGCVGVAVGAGGETGVDALDLEGERVWSLPREFVVYRLSTHPRLPGYVLSVGGGVKIIAHRGREVRVPYTSSHHSGFFAGHGVMFPDAEGAPAAVIAGKVHEGGVPAIRRMDAEGGLVWQATLPVQIEGLALLEPKGAPRLLAVTTERGELLLVDDAGTLLWRGDTPEAKPNDKVATYQLVAGEIARDRYGVIVRLLGNSYHYRLDLDVLKRSETAR